MWQMSSVGWGERMSKNIYVGSTRIATRNSRWQEFGTSYGYYNTYYYHSDHLGSAQEITDYKGSEYERIEYTPYGELWIEKVAAGCAALPYRFTGKEMDSETGLYYYGARYLDPKYSHWLSPDPAMGKYIPEAPVNDEAKKHNENLPGQGGVFNTVNLQVYHYAGNNPVKYVDPDGKAINRMHLFGVACYLGATAIVGAEVFASVATGGGALVISPEAAALAESLVVTGAASITIGNAIESGKNSTGLLTNGLGNVGDKLEPTFSKKTSKDSDPEIETQENKTHREKTRGAHKRDKQQINSVAKKYKLDPHDYGQYVEQRKAEEHRGPTDNYK